MIHLKSNCSLQQIIHFYLHILIIKLQKQSLSIHEQMEIYTSTESKLNGAPLEKFLASKGKNPDLLKFTSSSNNFDFRRITKYAPLVSADIERTFSTFSNIFTDNRQSLTEDNIEKMLLINYNSMLFN